MSLRQFLRQAEELPLSLVALNKVVTSLGPSWEEKAVKMDLFSLERKGRRYLVCENRYRLFCEMGLLEKYRILPPYSGWKPKGQKEIIPPDPYLLDLETTGTYGAKYFGIAQVAISPLNDPSQMFNGYVRRPYRMKPGDICSGMTWEFLEENGLPFPKVYAQMLKFVPPGSVVAYYARGHFDREFVKEECLRHRLEPPPWKWYQIYAKDTLSMAYRKCGGKRRLTAHRADDDVEMFREVYKSILTSSTQNESSFWTRPVSELYPWASKSDPSAQKSCSATQKGEQGKSSEDD